MDHCIMDQCSILKNAQIHGKISYVSICSFFTKMFLFLLAKQVRNYINDTFLIFKKCFSLISLK